MTTQIKSKQIRDIAFITHRYIGLAIGILAAAIAFTGSLLIIHEWTSSLFAPKVTVTPGAKPLAIAMLVSKAQAMFPNLTLESLEIPDNLTEPITAWWVATGDKWTDANINPYTGAMIGSPRQDSAAYTGFLYELHITLLGGERGAYVAGIVGLLTTLLCVTGIVLWPGWRKLSTGFKIKWKANIKRLNFDLHKVSGIIAAIFLSMAMFTGFVWNYGTWANPLIYAATFSPQPPAETELASKVTGQAPLPIAQLLQTATTVLPIGEITSVSLPTKPEGVLRVTKELPSQETASVSLDQFSGAILQVEGITGKSVGDRILDSFVPVHFGTFAGLPSQILYVFVGLSPTILLITGLIMWRHRRRTPTLTPVKPTVSQL
jgi:uncharacterized iron-regulated membrane protein